MVNQALLDLLFNSPDMFIGLFDVAMGKFRKVNAYGLRLFGTNDPAQLAKCLNDQLLNDHQYQSWSSSQKSKNHWRNEKLLRTHMGREFWAVVEIERFDHKEQQYLLFRICNINKFKEAKQDALESEEKFKAVFEHAAIGILMTDAQGTIVLANHYLHTLFGYLPEELMGQKVEILLPINFRAAHGEHRESYKSRPMGEGVELQGQHRNKTLFPVEVSLSYFYDKQKMYHVAFVQDISFKVQMTTQLLRQKAAIEKLNTNLENEVVGRTHALVETLQHLEKSKKDLEDALSKEKELSELKSRFVAMASHEFRTPLSIIQSCATLISRYNSEGDQEKRDKNVHRIQKSVGYLSDILDEFLSLGKLEEGQIKVTFSPVNWKEFMTSVIGILEPILKKGQKIDFQHTGFTTVITDESLIRKVMVNLISNAIKFSPEKACVWVNSQVQKGTLHITVKDEGIGIAETDLKHLSERFYRGRNATHIQGTGLGLHIVAKYVELLDGNFTISSSLGKGTTVALNFQVPDGNAPLDAAPVENIADHTSHR